MDDLIRSLTQIHRPRWSKDIVAIPPRWEIVCEHCEVSDGYWLWPCPTAQTILDANNPANTKATDLTETDSSCDNRA